MPYPDNMNWNAYDRAWGDCDHAIASAWEGHQANIYATLKRAYVEFPTMSMYRREMLGEALDKAERAITEYVYIPTADKNAMLMDYAGLMAADSAGTPEEVEDLLSDWMGILGKSVVRFVEDEKERESERGDDL